MLKTHVSDVYENIAEHFNYTRVAIWNGVRCFLDNLDKFSYVLDCGTGNGKYVNYRNDIMVHGVDMCSRLLEIAKERNNNSQRGNDFLRCSATQLPYRNDTFDAILCIAMFHHLDNLEDRYKCLEGFLRVLKPDGKMIITVWALEQEINKKWQCINGGDYLVPWTLKNSNTIYLRYYHLFSETEIHQFLNKFDNITYDLYYEMNNWNIIICKKKFDL